jgi:hypothetical protein
MIDTIFLSEKALQADWSRPEENKAWESFQQPNKSRKKPNPKNEDNTPRDQKNVFLSSGMPWARYAD